MVWNRLKKSILLCSFDNNLFCCYFASVIQDFESRYLCSQDTFFCKVCPILSEERWEKPAPWLLREALLHLETVNLSKQNISHLAMWLKNEFSQEGQINWYQRQLGGTTSKRPIGHQRQIWLQKPGWQLQHRQITDAHSRKESTSLLYPI